MQKQKSRVSERSLVVRLFLLLVLVSMVHQIAFAYTPAPPTNLRVDIADGNANQLIISWDQTNGAAYYNLQYSMSPSGPYSPVPNCYGSSDAVNYATPFSTEVCRHSNLAVTNPPTYYYYEVQACPTVDPCSPYTQTTPAVLNGTYNTPINCYCNAIQIPPMIASGQNYVAPNPHRPNTCTVITSISCDQLYASGSAEFGAVHNTSYSGIPVRNVLLVELPGSGSTCGYSKLMYTAQNLGFDAICVTYSNASEQESVCLGNPSCFYYISEVKFDGSGPCIQGNNYVNCGIDPKTTQSYWNASYDAVLFRVETMLQYLATTYPKEGWGQYLPSGVPNWSKIIVGGFSQGGDMATYAAGFEYRQGTPIYRAINLSAPPQAVPVNNVMTAATYLAGPPLWIPTASLSTVYGLVSANDAHYSDHTYGNSVYQAVWSAMGFTATNNDAERDLNCNLNSQAACYSQTPQGLDCQGASSHNLVNFAATSPQGGHDDTLAFWNQDIYEFMLID